MLKTLLSTATVSVLTIASGLAMTNCVQSFTPNTKATQTTGSPAPKKLVAQAASSLTPMEQAFFQQINQYRASQGMPALTLDSAITQQARIHSQDMANGRVPFGHQGFDQRVKAIGKSIPYRAAAENVAYNMGYKDPTTQAVSGLLKSPGHLKNIRGQYNLTGVGVTKNAKGEYYFAQVFVRK